MEKTIIIIDDDKDLLGLLVESFELEGFTCYSAQSANEALSVFAKNPCSIVLTDIVMPGENDGLDVIREIREINPSVLIYAMSGDSMDSSGTSMLDFAEVFGADKVLQKPFSVKDLLKDLAS